MFLALEAGKTTRLAQLRTAFKKGSEFCGRPVKPAQLLIVSEEPQSMWAKRREQPRIGNRVCLECSLPV